MTSREGATRSQSTVWKFQQRRGGLECHAALEAYWEVHLDPISDDFTQEEISAVDLFSRWARQIRKKSEDELIRISWFVNVEGPDVKTFEYMPFQLRHWRTDNPEDFLSFFTWPTNVQTGDYLNWLELPVVDKLWRPSRANKGGFLQEATGWKPSILQPYVYLPSLEKAARPY